MIPINNQDVPAQEQEEEKDDSVEYENHTYGAIFDFDEKTIERGEKSKGEADGYSRKEKDVAATQKESSSPRKEKESNSPRKEKDAPRKEKESSSRKEKETSPRKEKETSPRRGRDRHKAKQGSATGPDPGPPLPHRPVLRRLSERRRELAEAVPHASQGARQKVRRSSRRSSSLGPLLEGGLGDMGASTLSLESLDSNPRQAVPKSERGLGGAIPRRQGPLPPAPGVDTTVGPPSPTHPLVGSPPRNMNELPPGIRPPPYHPLASIGPHAPPPPAANSPFPPMIPLPGLTCQLSIPPGLPLPPGPPRDPGGEPRPERSLREQQVFHLRQEISHPAGVRLQLRKKDVQTSLALGDLFGCVWVLGWKQREYPVLYNAFHMGDQVALAPLSKAVWSS